MTAVLQRVYSATVYADGEKSGEIGAGLYILLGVEQGDNDDDARLLATKIAKLRIFCDENGKMNLSVNDIGGDVMVVSNFTLAANYAHGNRPDYLMAAPPLEANRLYELFKSLISDLTSKQCASGVFGADMRTEMSTNGPVTIVMHSAVLRGGKK